MLQFLHVSSFEPCKQQYPREIFSRLFYLKYNNGLNRNHSDCTGVQFCFVGWFLSHQRRTRRKGKNLWVWLSMSVCVRVCETQSKRSVHVISISQSCCENKMTTLPDCREGILQRQHIAKRTKASLRYGCVRHTVNVKASYHFLLK